MAFLCNWAPYRCYLDMGREGPRPAPPIHPVKVMCAGRIDPSILLYAFEKGAEGVMLVGCRDKACRYGPGPQQAEKTAERLRALLGVLGLEPERFLIKTYDSHERNRLFEDTEAFVRKIGRLQKSPFVA